jgi:hypothetical protein
MKRQHVDYLKGRTDDLYAARIYVPLLPRLAIACWTSVFRWCHITFGAHISHVHVDYSFPHVFLIHLCSTTTSFKLQHKTKVTFIFQSHSQSFRVFPTLTSFSPLAFLYFTPLDSCSRTTSNQQSMRWLNVLIIEHSRCPQASSFWARTAQCECNSPE